ncbi:MAG: hypothetical protein JSR18_02915 [Proteobacteria bacterium]|nr:hypothetical protein [Pseudomonadota bacterium]
MNARPRRTRIAARVLLAACCAVAAAASASERVYTVPTRPGVTDAYLEVVRDGAPKKAIVVVFVGGLGTIHLAERAAKDRVKFGPGANFLVRIREALAGDDMAVEVVDTPSDRQDAGLTDAFRMSADHATDVRAIVADAKSRYPQAPVYLVGTSRGTVSAAYVGAVLGDAIAGVVLTSTITVPSRVGPGVATFDFGKLRAPLLLVHSVDDACPQSPYAGAARLGARYPLVSVASGLPPQSGPCEPLAPHGYFGMEAQTTSAIRAFMLGQPFPRSIP